MSFRRVYVLTLLIVSFGGGALAYAVGRSVGFAIAGAVVGAMLLQGPLAVVVDVMVRLLGDTSRGAMQNIALQFALTARSLTAARKRIARMAPRADLDDLFREAGAAIRALIGLAEKIERGAITEERARTQMKERFAFVDEDNLEWLSAVGRAYLKARATVSTPV